MNQPAHLQHPEHDKTMDDIFGEFGKIMSRARRAARQAQQSARQARDAQRRSRQQNARTSPADKTKVDAPRTATDRVAELVGRWAAAHAAADAAHAAADAIRAERDEAAREAAERRDTDLNAANSAAERADAYAAAWDERMRAEGINPDSLPSEDVAVDATELSERGEQIAQQAEEFAEEYTADQLDNPDAASAGLDGTHKNVGDLVADAHPDGGELNLDAAGTEFDPGADVAGVAAQLGTGVDTGVGVDQ